MRITCDDVDDFLVNVMEEGPDNVSQKVIHVSYIKKPIDASSGTNFVVKLGILLQASAVMNTKDGEGQYLLEMGQHCGFDYVDKTQEFKGTEKATKLKKQIEDFCNQNGLTTRPGVIDM